MDMLQSLTGRTLGTYQLLERIGGGGMGVVYRAHQPSMRRSVAIKLLPLNLTDDPDYSERFRREAEIAGRLEHASIIPVYDYAITNTAPPISYIVMRLLTGGSLAERMRARAASAQPLPSLGETAALLKAVAAALDYAHGQGVIHRDIKPANIMFDGAGAPMVMDFGIARLLDATSVLTNAGLVGTPQYMAPEQWRNEAITPAADQYALGVLVYLLVGGKSAFEAQTPLALMNLHLHETPTPAHILRPGVPQAVSHVLERALAKQPGERFPTVTAFAQAFDAAIEGAHGTPTDYFTFKLSRPDDETRVEAAPALAEPAPVPPPPPTFPTPSLARPPQVSPPSDAPPDTGRAPALPPANGRGRPLWVSVATGGAALVGILVVAFLATRSGSPPDALALRQTSVALGLTETAMNGGASAFTSETATEGPAAVGTAESAASPTPPPTRASKTPEPLAINLPMPTATQEPTDAPTDAPTATRTPRPSRTPTATNERTATDERTATRTPRPSRTPSATVTPVVFSMDDHIFPITQRALWTGVNAEMSGLLDWAVETDPYLIYERALDICLAEYSHIVVELEQNTPIGPGEYVEVFYTLTPFQDFAPTRSIILYPRQTTGIQMLSARIPASLRTSGARLRGIRLDPYDGGYIPGTTVTVRNFRLLADRDAPGRCPEPTATRTPRPSRTPTDAPTATHEPTATRSAASLRQPPTFAGAETTFATRFASRSRLAENWWLSSPYFLGEDVGLGLELNGNSDYSRGMRRHVRIGEGEAVLLRFTPDVGAPELFLSNSVPYGSVTYRSIGISAYGGIWHIVSVRGPDGASYDEYRTFDLSRGQPIYLLIRIRDGGFFDVRVWEAGASRYTARYSSQPLGGRDAWDSRTFNFYIGGGYSRFTVDYYAELRFADADADLPDVPPG
jgi:serine/threonine-protein kinase